MLSPAISTPPEFSLSLQRSQSRPSPSSITSPGASSSSGGSTPSRPASAIFLGNSSAAAAALISKDDTSHQKTLSRASQTGRRSTTSKGSIGEGGLPSPPATNSDATSSAGRVSGRVALKNGKSLRGPSGNGRSVSSLTEEVASEDSQKHRPTLSSRHRVSSTRISQHDSGSSLPLSSSPMRSPSNDPSPERAAAHYSALMALTSERTPNRVGDSRNRDSGHSNETTPRRPSPGTSNGRSPGTDSLRKLVVRPSTTAFASPGSPLGGEEHRRASSRHQHTASSSSSLSAVGVEPTSSSASASRRRARKSLDHTHGSPSPSSGASPSKRGSASIIGEINLKDTIRRSHTISHDRQSPGPVRLTNSEVGAALDEVEQSRERVGTWMNGQGDESGGSSSRFNSGGSDSKRKPLPQDFRNGSLFSSSSKAADTNGESPRDHATPSRYTPSDYSSPRRSVTIASRGYHYDTPSSPFTPSGLSRVRQSGRYSATNERTPDVGNGTGYLRKTWHDTISGLPRPGTRAESVLDGDTAYRYQSRGGSAESALTTQRLAERDRLRPMSAVGLTPSPGRSKLRDMDSVSQRLGPSEAGGPSDPLEVLARMEMAREESQRKRALLLQERPQSVLASPRERDRFNTQRYENPRPPSRSTWTPAADRQPLRSATSLSFIRDREPRTAPAGLRAQRYVEGIPESPSVGRGTSRASWLSSATGSAQGDWQVPRTMPGDSSLGSRPGQLPTTSVTEHGRLLLEACRSVESRLASSAPSVSELVRCSHVAARTSESSNSLLREALATAAQAQIQIEVEGMDGREVLVRLMATLREASKSSDESVRSLTGILLSLPKVVRDGSGMAPRRSGSFETESTTGSGRSGTRHVRTPANFTRRSIEVETRSAASFGDRSSPTKRSIDQESPRRSGSLLSFAPGDLFNGTSPGRPNDQRLPLPSIPSTNDIDVLSAPSHSSPTTSSQGLLRKKPSTLTVKGAAGSTFFPAIRGSAPTTALSQVTAGDAVSSPTRSSSLAGPRGRLNSVGSDQDDTVSILERKLASADAKRTDAPEGGQRNSVDSKSSTGKANRFWRRASKGPE